MLNYNHMGVGQKIREFRRERDWSQDYLGVSINTLKTLANNGKRNIR